ncbi:MAG: hypothetical protein R3E89_10375 [Thiolinea sp.]
MTIASVGCQPHIHVHASVPVQELSRTVNPVTVSPPVTDAAKVGAAPATGAAPQVAQRSAEGIAGGEGEPGSVGPAGAPDDKGFDEGFWADLLKTFITVCVPVRCL